MDPVLCRANLDRINRMIMMDKSDLIYKKIHLIYFGGNRLDSKK
jgi:hypothetical protein